MENGSKLAQVEEILSKLVRLRVSIVEKEAYYIKIEKLQGDKKISSELLCQRLHRSLDRDCDTLRQLDLLLTSLSDAAEDNDVDGN